MTYTYKITINGYGGEYTLGRITKPQFEFWSDEVMSILKGYNDSEDALSEYLNDVWEMNDDPAIPDAAKMEYNWYEIDDVCHIYGGNMWSSYINIDQVDAESEASIVSESIEDFAKANELEHEWQDWDWPDDEELYLLEGISSEKGTFFETTLQLDKPIDTTKFKFNVQETYNEEDIVVGLEYDGEELDNDGGSTNGKGYYFTLHNCC